MEAQTEKESSLLIFRSTDGYRWRLKSAVQAVAPAGATECDSPGETTLVELGGGSGGGSGDNLLLLSRCGDGQQLLGWRSVDGFSEYLENHNKGRPFIIAGHSQGALHGQRLVHEHISQQPIRELFIAAYLIGYILPIKYFDQLYPDLIISNDAEDQHSIISWCTGTKDFRRSRAHSMLWLPNGWCQEPMEQPLVCQNPFSWNTKSDWISDEDNLSIRLKASNLFLADYYATKHSHSDLTIDAINNLGFEARHSENSMIETQGPLIEKMKSFTTGALLIYQRHLRQQLKSLQTY